MTLANRVHKLIGDTLPVQSNKLVGYAIRRQAETTDETTERYIRQYEVSETDQERLVLIVLNFESRMDGSGDRAPIPVPKGWKL